MAAERLSYSNLRRYFRACGVHATDENIILFHQQYKEVARTSFGLALCFHHQLPSIPSNGRTMRLPADFTEFVVLHKWDPDADGFIHQCPNSEQNIILSFTKTDTLCTMQHHSHFLEQPVSSSCGLLFCNQRVNMYFKFC